jgi:hypothetical protein
MKRDWNKILFYVYAIGSIVFALWMTIISIATHGAHMLWIG